MRSLLRSLPLLALTASILGAQEPPQQTRFRGGGEAGAYKTRLVPHWFAGHNHFWYRNDLRGGKREYVFVDAERGQRTTAFDHGRLTQALRAVTDSRDLDADRLTLDILQLDRATQTMTFRHAGRSWKCDLQSYELQPIEAQPDTDRNPASGLRPANGPRASLRTGAETEIHFLNKTAGAVELLWLDAEGGRHGYGQLPAGSDRRQHTYAGHAWLVVDATGRALATFVADDEAKDAIITNEPVSVRPFNRDRPAIRNNSRGTSPDGRWQATTRSGNLFVRPAAADGAAEVQLTDNGNEDSGYERLQWSPDSHSLIAWRVQPAEIPNVYLVESSPRNGGRAILHQRPYALPGDKFATFELYLFRLSTDDPATVGNSPDEQPSKDHWQTIKPTVEPLDFGQPQVHWSRDGSWLAYTKIDRGHQRLRLIAVDTVSGKPRNVIDEQTDTFIWTAHNSSFNLPPITWLDDSDELIYASEVDGWRHLYLIDATIQPADGAGTADGADLTPQRECGSKRLIAPGMKHQVTQGEWVVRGVERIDQEKRQVWLRASGLYADQDPYFIHHVRVNFDGSGWVALTDGNGSHSVQYSPDRRYLIDSYSRVDAPPIHELRRTEDGGLLCQLERADISELTEQGWSPPEVFVAKGRDGVTDIWGIICRPGNFEPSRKYPVVEDLYAGPHDSYVPKTFSTRSRYDALNRAGYIVVKIDGMGTANRSKAFHDVCWHNLKDAGFPDRIRWLKAAAQKDSSLDLARVGVYGGSAGGQNAAAAVLFHPEFYRVAVAGCGCHDNRLDKASWNEQWMGYPVGPQYAECSNIDNAAKLQGKLLLIVGEMDTNVPPESTLRLADALIKADKDFDLLVVPGAGHGMGGRYGTRRMHDYFERHLLDDGK